jgi:2-dehydro-3-deoxyphosphogalactonate aldolase
MKVTGVQTYSVKVPPPHKGGREWYFLKLETDQGVHGWGEMALLSANFGKSRSLEHEAQEITRDFVVGQDPRRREWIWRRMYQTLFCHHADLTRSVILSAVDMALWDIFGKLHDVPVYQLLGGVYRDRVRSYSYIYDEPTKDTAASSLWLDPVHTAERAAAMADQGFTGLKLDPVPQKNLRGDPATPWHLTLGELDTAEETIRRIRDAVGSKCDILIGTHGQITAAAAIRLAKRLEPYDPLWLEEPVPPENATEMAKVAQGTSIPIATGERLTTVWDFQRVFDAGAVAIAQPDLCCCGGITEFRKIAGMAQAYYVDMAPHLWGGPVLTAASIQVDVCTPNFLIQESIEQSHGFFDELVVTPFQWEDGDLIPSDAPGLGVELNEEALAKHAIS